MALLYYHRHIIVHDFVLDKTFVLLHVLHGMACHGPAPVLVGPWAASGRRARRRARASDRELSSLTFSCSCSWQPLLGRAEEGLHLKNKSMQRRARRRGLLLGHRRQWMVPVAALLDAGRWHGRNGRSRAVEVVVER